MKHTNPSPQRQREYALYRYVKALERGDFETVMAILEQAEHDSILSQMITDISVLDAQTTSELQRSATINSTNGQDTHLVSSRNGQSPKLNHFQKDKMMTTQMSHWQEKKVIPPRSNPLASALMVILISVVVGGLLLTITTSRQSLVAPIVQPATPEPLSEIITPENIDQLVELVTIPKNGAPLSRVAFSPDSSLIAYEDHQKQIQVWNVGTQTAGQTFPAPEMLAQGRILVFSPDGKKLAANGEAEIIIWDLETAASVTLNSPLVMWQLGTFPSRMAFSADGKMFYRIMCGHSSDAEYTCDRLDVYGWDTVSGERSVYLMNPTPSKPDAFPLAAANLWVQGDANGQIIVRDLTSGATSSVLLYKGAAVALLGGSSDGTLVSVVDAVPSLKIFNVQTSNLVMESSLKDQAYAVRLMAFSPDNQLLATIGAPGDTSVQFWDVEAAAPIHSLTATDNNHLLSAAFSPDGRLLMTDSNDDSIRIWGVKAAPKL